MKNLTLILTLLPALTLTVVAENKVVTSGTVMEADQTYEAVPNYAALQVSGSETFYRGTNLTLSGSAIANNGRWSAYVYDQGRLDLHDVTGSGGPSQSSYAVYATGSSTLTITGGTFTTTGYLSDAILANAADSVSLSGVTVATTGDRSFAVSTYNHVTLTIIGSTITATGSDGRGVRSQDGFATLTDTVITATSALTTNAFHLAATGTAILNNVNITASKNAICLSGSASERPVLIINGGSFVSERNALILGADMGAAALITITGADLVAPVVISTEAVSGFNNMPAAEIAITDSTLTGDIAGNALSTLTIDLNRSTLTGDLIANDNATLTVSGSNGTGITGNVTGSGTATLDLTVSGPGTSLLGDIAQHDDAAVTVTIDHGATGSGGFTGGNLVTGGDSAWTFDKDSHGDYGKNDGVWNIGDYDVIFDNLTNSGTVTISVNSDTGDGGSIIVETATGDGTVHIDTTGNGQLNPNDVLPGIVSGAGTEHWQWDPIDWGIDQLIKDGDHFIKNGTSPAGAVLNSAIAVQQSMWFAQQNSLLKRMGELRYGARASRPPAGGTPALHNLIDNIWIRSYGQQLNVGSQVVGKAYEQLIYGVDLGTDHKFTLNADNDLYLGIYAGYGRSDLDYRTPDADGELNSYSGGFYATWLHSSGFYLDATFKAASVDNDLKAPYGTTQLTANYSDVNLGGSLEIGKKFTFSDAWFIEPQFQVNYLHILAEDYTAGPMTLKAQDLDALQLRLGSLFGRTIKLTNSGALQPYVKISGVETISSGGTLRNGYQHTRANTDGARAELGAGLIWQLDADNQLHLDYEASFGDKYDKPWGLTAGYRHQF
ncbi:MAG: autotransporter outer membrane beta-barrel domain-containing protein [Verrucomicrobiales bacterium]|jgi:outer membrane autotransporter protein|nr:autotransporter outer membrane beta-barrel domain-containing protein [Verrucomicrobiales bacterium]